MLPPTQPIDITEFLPTDREDVEQGQASAPRRPACDVHDGWLHKISEEPTWRYDLTNRRKPWRITGGGLDATFTPFYN